MKTKMIAAFALMMGVGYATTHSQGLTVTTTTTTTTTCTDDHTPIPGLCNPAFWAEVEDFESSESFSYNCISDPSSDKQKLAYYICNGITLQDGIYSIQIPEESYRITMEINYTEDSTIEIKVSIE